jgi:hypothetical protein
MLFGLEKFPVGLYLRISDDANALLWTRLLNRYGTVLKVAKRFGGEVRSFYYWEKQARSYPLQMFIQLRADVELQNLPIEELKTVKASIPLLNPRIPIKVNGDLAEFMGHLLHDGCISCDEKVHYATSKKVLVERFKYLVKQCFGDVIPYEWVDGRAIKLRYPAILAKLLRGLFGVPSGSKVANDVGIPKIIAENMDQTSIQRYVAAAFTCDGYSKRVALACSGKSSECPPRLLSDCERLLNKMEVYSTYMARYDTYETKKNGSHCRWVLGVERKGDREFLRKLIHRYFTLL